jgi:GTP cyclohydrolase I
MLLSSVDSTTSEGEVSLSQVTKSMSQDPAIMPDIANDRRASVEGTLHCVGMQDVELPIRCLQKDGSLMTVAARADLYVNLADPDSKGIHMSRLYKIAMEQLTSQTLDFKLMNKILGLYLESHHDISTEARIELKFELMTLRPSLKSGLEGWRSYPVHFKAETKGGKTQYEAEVQVTYSSTCPCSASLARQLIQKRFMESFSEGQNLSRAEMLDWLGKEDSICATPHSQRSIAHVRVVAEEQFTALDLIDQAEEALSTPVQAMVKREDEQEFALLNGRNLMFCEDAARRLKAALNRAQYADFRCEVQHFESLHPHDAVAIVVKGLEGGFIA